MKIPGSRIRILKFWCLGTKQNFFVSQNSLGSMRNHFLKLFVVACFFAASAEAFAEPRITVPKTTGLQTKVDAFQFSEPRSSRGNLLGHVIGRVTNRIVNGFLSERHDAKCAALQVIFLMGLIELMFSNDYFIKPSPD